MATESGRIEDQHLKFDAGVDTVQPKKESSHSKKSDGNSSFLRAARAGNLEKVLGYLKESIDINTSNANGLNALHLASKEGHVNVVTELLSRGANVDAATKKGNTALHIAALAGQEEIVKILVQSGAKVNAQATTGGFTPLYMAAQENHVEVVKYMINNGASQTLTTDDGFTPLAVALQQGHDKIVTVLLENDTRGRVRLPALHIAAKKDDVKSAALLLERDHNVDGQSKSGFTPLHISSHYGNINVGTLLIDKGADVNFQARNNIQPMHVASKWGKTNMVSLLLDNKADMESHTRDGLTPLHCAARSGHDQVVDALLERGADVASKTKNKLSPLHMAAQGDHADCARILLIHKAPIDDVTVDYLTPLHVAAHCGNVKTAKLLLDRKCEVDARALNGFTPLHIACKKNRIKVVELLLKYGASIEATTETGLTPLHVAAFMGHMNIVQYLIQNGANPDTPNMRGETALHHAARANQTDIIRVLLRNGATVDARARENQTPLHIAARLGNTDNVLLLLQHGAQVDAATKDAYTPLHIASKEGHEETAAVLLEHGADQNLKTKKGFTPLHIAAKYGNIKVARLLLQKDANPNVEGKNGLTPLHVATHYNHVNVALLLLEHKASPHATAKNGYTPLHIAAKKNQMDIATTLLEYGAKTNAESKNGFTPLHLASQEGHTDMVSLLLEHGAGVDCKARNGLTPMHLAAQEDKVPVAEILVKYSSTIDPQTKAGYTPLHTACHFGQINMIRFLLEHNASVNATTKLGYTPLHQAAQQGHVLVINLLLKYKASPNAVSNTGQTPLSIAQRLGYISVVEILKNITEVQAAPIDQEDKYNLVSPEIMQETLMTDSEDEGDDDHHTMGDQSFNYITTQDLHDDSISPIKTDERDFSYFERYSIADRQSASALSSQPPDDMQQYLQESSFDQMPPVFEKMDSVFETNYASAPPQEDYLQAASAPANYASKAQEERNTSMYGSYSGVSFASSFDPDNVAVDRQPIYSGFLVSFMVDARGGAMRGCRHSGVRIIIPPGKATMPTRVTCKLVRKEKLLYPPPLMEGEALASRILEMGPVGAKFLGPVIIEVPHFASLRGKEREIVVLRSDNGETWKEHPIDATEEAIHDALGGSFEDLETAEDLYKKRITRVLTTDFPQYFAVVTRIRQESTQIGQEGGVISSTVVPQVQAIFTEGALTKKIKVGLQAQPVPSEIVTKMLGNRVAVSPIVTVEPRRRKFHKPITLTIPVPKAAQKGMLNQYGGDAPTLRLLCSITGGTNTAHWEDITGTTPLQFVDDCVSFTTTVSARYWLMDCQNTNEAARMATDLYREAIAVPFMSKFVVFTKRRDNLESRLRVFCMTDDKMEKTLESQEHFKEVARSRDVEVLEGKAQYVEMGGNIVPVTKSGDQLYINFHAFRENRLPFTVRVRDTNQNNAGRVAFMNEPKSARGEAQQQPICTLNLTLPDYIKGEGEADVDSQDAEELRRKYELLKSGVPGEDQNINRAELQLTDIADALQGDWVMLAQQLGITEDEIYRIQTEYTYVCEQALVMLHLWVQKNGERATGNELEKALKKIGREDVIRKCMTNVEVVTDVYEKAVAQEQLDHEDGFDELRGDIGTSAEPSRDSSVQRGTSLDVSYDEKDMIKESESAAEESEREQTPVEQSSPIHEEPMAPTQYVADEPAQPIEDLIDALERKDLECMDDRMSQSSEEAMVIREGDIKEQNVLDREAFVQQTTTILESTPIGEESEAMHRVSGDFAEGEGQLVPMAEGQLEIAEGGDLQTTKLVMKKQIHKKTIIRDGKEETIVTEDTHVEQDEDGPEELKDSMQTIIDQFMTNTEHMGKDDQ